MLAVNLSHVCRFKAGLRHGEGVGLVPGLFVYRGQWQADVRQGEGECCYADGGKYTGGWENDMRHGTGTCVSCVQLQLITCRQKEAAAIHTMPHYFCWSVCT